MSLKASNLILEKGGTTILDGVDFQASSGELVGVLGPSGSGKSSLLLALAGFWEADTGSVIFKGRDLHPHFDDLKRDIGFVPQDDIVPTVLQVERVLKYAAELRLPDFPARERRGRVTGVIQTLDLADQRDSRVATLSGGQRKRVSVGVELLSRPDVLLADEPTSGLDPALERSLTQTFQDLTDDGSTVIVSTHVMSSLDLLDRVCVLHGGCLAYQGPVERLKDYFGVDDYTAIYTRLNQHEPREWRRRFEGTTS